MDIFLLLSSCGWCVTLADYYLFATTAHSEQTLLDGKEKH